MIQIKVVIMGVICIVIEGRRYLGWGKLEYVVFDLFQGVGGVGWVGGFGRFFRDVLVEDGYRSQKDKGGDSILG